MKFVCIYQYVSLFNEFMGLDNSVRPLIGLYARIVPKTNEINEMEKDEK
ncbi:MAG: hypothetical protein WC581_11400 [Thermodesulfovibrionales bacterium]